MSDIRGVQIETETQWTFQTPHGKSCTFTVRPGTSDWNTVNACTGTNDEYHLPQGLIGWALDVGAHIGACTVPLLLDNPDLRVVAIEALPENADLLRENLERNGVADRAVIYQRAASNGTAPVAIGYGIEPVHEFIGGKPGDEFHGRVVQIPGISLGEVILSVAAATGVPPIEVEFVWAKSDCEGGEYGFFDSPSVGQIRYIEGEVHFGIGPLRKLLEATHVVTGTKDFGPFSATRR